MLPRLAIENEHVCEVVRAAESGSSNVGFGTCLTSYTFDYTDIDSSSSHTLKSWAQKSTENGFVGLFISILAQFLSGDDASQKELMRLNGIQMIAYALKHIRKDLFRVESERSISAISLLKDACSMNSSLEKAVLEELLCNFEIWSKASTELQKSFIDFLINTLLMNKYLDPIPLPVEIILKQIDVFCIKNSETHAEDRVRSARRFGSIDVGDLGNGPSTRETTGFTLLTARRYSHSFSQDQESRYDDCHRSVSSDSAISPPARRNIYWSPLAQRPIKEEESAVPPNALRIQVVDDFTECSEMDSVTLSARLPSMKSSPRTPRTPRGGIQYLNLESAINAEEERLDKERTHRTYMRQRLYCLLLHAFTTRSTSSADFRRLFRYLQFCDDLDVLVDLSNLLLFLIIRGGTAVVNAILSACCSSEGFASLVLFKLIGRSRETLRCNGIRILTHFFLRLENQPTSPIGFPLNSRKPGIESFHQLGGTTILEMILKRYAEQVSIHTYSALLEMLLLHNELCDGYFTKNYPFLKTEIKPDANYDIPMFNLDSISLEHFDELNVCILPIFLGTITCIRNETLRDMLRDILILLQNCVNAKDSLLSLNNWHTYFLRISTNLVHCHSESGTRSIEVRRFYEFLERSTRSSQNSESAYSQRRLLAAPVSSPRETTTFLKWISLANASFSTDSNPTHEQFLTNHASFSYCMEIYAQLIFHCVVNTPKNCKEHELSKLLEYTKAVKDGFGVGLTILAHINSKFIHSFDFKGFARGSGSETFVFQERRASRARINAVLSHLCTSANFILSDYTWMEYSQTDKVFEAAEEGKPEFELLWPWTYFISNALMASTESSGNAKPDSSTDVLLRELQLLLFLTDDVIEPPFEITYLHETRITNTLLSLKLFDRMFWFNQEDPAINISIISTIKNIDVLEKEPHDNVIGSTFMLCLYLMHELFPFNFASIKNLRRLRFLLKCPETKYLLANSRIRWIYHTLSQTVMLLARLRYSVLSLLERLHIVSDPSSFEVHKQNAYQFESIMRDPHHVELVESIFNSDFGCRFFDVALNALFLLVSVFSTNDDTISESQSAVANAYLRSFVDRVITEYSYEKTETTLPPSPSSVRTRRSSVEFPTLCHSESNSSDESWDWMEHHRESSLDFVGATLSAYDILHLLQFLCDIALSSHVLHVIDIFHRRFLNVEQDTKNDCEVLDMSSNITRAEDEGNRISKLKIPVFAADTNSNLNALPLWNACLSFYRDAWSPWFDGNYPLRYEFAKHRDNYLRRMILTRMMEPRDYTDSKYSIHPGDNDAEFESSLLLSNSAISKEIIRRQLDFFKPLGQQQVGQWGDDFHRFLTKTKRPPSTRSRSSLNSAMFAGSFSPAEIEKRPDWTLSLDWSDEEKQVFAAPARLVLLEQTLSGAALLTNKHLFFHPESVSGGVIVEPEDLAFKTRRWVLECLQETFGRRYLLKNCGIELFFADSPEVFIAFDSLKDLQSFFSSLRRQHVPRLISPPLLNPRHIFGAQKWTEAWRRRLITNFEYLMRLNLMGGRSFNDISQYPVFPWVVADYESRMLDLKNSNTFRDLNKPIGALNDTKLRAIIEVS